MAPQLDVVCSGIIVADHVAAPVDRIPDAGHLVLTDECFLSIGGCASNVAVDLAKMGVAATVNGCIGDDVFGRFARKVLEDHGVDTTPLITTADCATSQTMILNVKGEDRRFVHHLGANRIFCGAHFPRETIRSAKILYVGGYFLMDSLTGEQLGAMFREAREAGVLTVLDVVTPGPCDYMPQLRPVLPHTDVFLPNNDEGRWITGQSDPVEQCKVMRDAGAHVVVITCGGNGAVLDSGTARLRAHAFDVPFVDGTGGGDAFDAGYICGLLENASPERCLALGSALGASCVRQSGATDGVFNREQLEAFLSNNAFVVDRV